MNSKPSDDGIRDLSGTIVTDASGGANVDVAGNAIEQVRGAGEGVTEAGIKAESGLPDLGKTAKDAASGVVVKAGVAVGGAVENAIGGAAGKVAGAIAGGIAGGAVGLGKEVRKGAPRANFDDEMPFFEDIAVTSSNPAKAAQGAVAKAKEVIAGGLASVARKTGGKNLEVEIASGDKLDLRKFSVHERLSALFQVNLVVVSDNPSIEFDDVVGQPAKFSIVTGLYDRFWCGMCNHFEQVRVEPTGLSTYQLSIVPTLWLLTQRKNHRIFQQTSEPDIVLKLLSEWEIEPALRLDKGAYKKRKYRVQYAESDFAFMSRMLEDAGITFYFEQDGDETKLVLSDAPQANPKRGVPLEFMDDTSTVQNVQTEFVTSVRMGQRVRPGKYTMRDHDYRKPPTYKLLSSASKGLAVEKKLERFQYVPGAFLFGADSGEVTPNADDKGKTRTDEKEAAVLAQKRLDAKRGSARVVTFETNAYDLAPGVVMEMSGHPHAALGEGKSLLVVESSLSGTDRGEWSQHCEVRGTEIPFRPELRTPRPKVNGVESATVVGPAGEEIHTDEFGRVRVHFHWDRESKMDDSSSCWIHVSQPWGGAGYGGTNLPRIGQEVLVDFLGGDPDRPVIVGRVYTNLQKTPYKLPENKTQSGWKSNSTGRSGGYNEIMFEDAAGKELLNIQAERDLKKLVKNDESVTIGRNRTKRVKANDSLTVEKNRTKQVVQSERVTIGKSQSVSVGINRSVQVGSIDSTMVGDTHSVMVSPPGEWLQTEGSTSIVLKNRKIILDTGAGAKIVLHKNRINISASVISVSAKRSGVFSGGTGLSFKSRKKKIKLTANQVEVNALSDCSVIGKNGVTIGAKGGAVDINGGPMVNINGPGLHAGRVTDLAPAAITRGASFVLVGGPTTPRDITVDRDANGNITAIHYGSSITIMPDPNNPNYMSQALAAVVRLDNTPTMHAAYDAMEATGHTMTIIPYVPPPGWGPYNAYARPGSSADAQTPGVGTNTTIGWSPDVNGFGLPGTTPPSSQPGSDIILAHEQIHAVHNAQGTQGNGPYTSSRLNVSEERNTVGLPADTYTLNGDPLNGTQLPDTTGGPFTENQVREDYRDFGWNSPITNEPPVERPSYHRPTVTDGPGEPF
ncbi:type VI secretion system tip protein TssI/VgrG [Sorangium sp. So ce1151]|uniref:type VI secretion system tip protein TssI/VgrG n=1 Tax=Sorangium sp. So ce1151 TaxID=3133332 RepID=UPI003F5E1A89